MYIVSFALDKTSYSATLQHSHRQVVLKLESLKKIMMKETEFIGREGKVYNSEMCVVF